MTQHTRVALFLLGELIAALRANDADTFRGLVSEGIQELGAKEVEDLLLDRLYSFLTVEEQDRLTGWHLGVNLRSSVIAVALLLCDQNHSYR